MIELRWVCKKGEAADKAVLQYREKISSESEWSEEVATAWKSVPLVVVDEMPDDATACCAGGPQWGHSWDCKKLPG